VFDITARFGTNRTVFQTHSSNDDKVHSATLQVTNTGKYLGCFVYSERTGKYTYFPKQGTLDECQIDKCGRYLMILQNIDNRYDMENVFVDLQTGAKTVVYDQNGALGHHDMGYGYAVGMDNWNPLPNAAILFSYTPTAKKRPTVFHSLIGTPLPLTILVSAMPNRIFPCLRRLPAAATPITQRSRMRFSAFVSTVPGISSSWRP
jgi:hypothetical protein